MLSAANVQFKPDKYTTLVTVADFIRSLQERVEVLDAEHKKLLNTIVQTSQAVNGQYLPQVSAGGASVSASSDSASMRVSDFFDDGKISPLEDDDGREDGAVVPAPGLVGALDYKAVFDCCPVASAVTSIDGRFMDCNQDFESLVGFLKSELVVAPARASQIVAPDGAQDRADAKKPARSMSLFNTVTREHMERVFRAMSEMLRVPFPGGPGALAPPGEPEASDTWSGVVALVRKEGVKVRAAKAASAFFFDCGVGRCTYTFASPPLQVNLGLSLVRGGQGRPKFFSCTMIPVEHHAAGSAAVG
jgi:PAS domain-containing protein